ncbi:hypothetical protein [Chryseobacterium fistulae]|uniref:Polysaccharide biosynthesis protein n=1 Tax=Chryseobacterium fistulae TaxID=2675058 RepID=A0A6N4XV06_9FLAO|nr:hypothetical protein [Chryseobacterium fistulae]CAA7392878.1 hypothetical protein CHRY9393_03421 [Chryseobacterium fistulae]
MKKIKEILSKPSSWVLTDQLIFSGSNFLLTFLLARQLSIPDFGLFSSILLVTYLLVGICNAIIVQPFQILSAKGMSEKSLGFVFQASLFLISIIIVLLVTVHFLPIAAIEFFTKSLSAIILFTTGYIFQDFLRKILLTIDRIKLVILMDSIFLIVFPLLYFEKSMDLFKSLHYIGIVNLLASIPGIIFFLRNSHFNLKNGSLIVES